MTGATTHPSTRLVDEAAGIIREGGVILYPTETVYGLGCHPASHDAVQKIQTLKGRDAQKPMLVLTDSWQRVADWFGALDPLHDRLMEIGTLHPLTILFPASAAVPESFRGGSPLVGIRCTSDAFCRAVIASANAAILSTSANPAGAPAPASFSEIDPELLGKVDLAIDAGRPLEGRPSTVVRVASGEIEVMREGAVPKTHLLDLIESR